mgnify:CR=1 FL=1
MPLDPSIALGIKPLDIESPVNSYAKLLQLQNVGYARDYNKLKLSNETENQNQLKSLKDYYGSNDISTPQGQQGLLKFGKSGAELLKAVRDQEKAQLDQQKAKLELFGKATEQAREGLAGITPTDVNGYKNWIVGIHKDPIYGPMLDAKGDTLEKTLAKVDAAVASNTFGQLFNESKMGVEKALENVYQAQNLGGTTQVLAIPKYGQGQASVVPGSQQTVTRSPNAPQTTVNVSNNAETAYAKEFGQQVAKSHSGLFDTANKADELINASNQISDLVKSGHVFTGTGANLKLQMAKAFQLAGVDDKERIANTELLITNMGKGTLAAVKSAGLGTGQGFTDKDREFVEKAAVGKLSYDPESINRIARLSKLASLRAIEKWNNSYDKMPASIKNLGVGKVDYTSKGFRYLGGDPSKESSWEPIKR